MEIFRMSGRPSDPTQLGAYEAEFRTRYDELAVIAGPDMLKLHESLIKLDEELKAKYKLVENIELPKSKKQWQALVTHYEAPLMIANKADGDNELVVVIMDEKMM